MKAKAAAATSDRMTEWLKEARRLRAEADHAEFHFLTFLYEGEKDESLWGRTGWTYDQFLEREHLLISGRRYSEYRRARKNLGDRFDAYAEAVGLEGVLAAGGLADPRAQQEVIEEVQASERSNGTTASEQTAKTIGREVQQRFIGAEMATGGEHVPSGRRSYAVLYEENKRLRHELEERDGQSVALKAENRKVTAENAKLRTEVERLKARLSGKASTSPKKKAA